MKKSDKILNDLFKKNMQKIEDDSFTERIINIHLSRQKKPIYKPFLNFDLIIIGISSVFISIGLIFSIITKTILVENFVFTEQYGLILLLISLIFLISVWIENFIAPKNRVSNKI
jgi:cytochrome c biogenesis protein CcdA